MAIKEVKSANLLGELRTHPFNEHCGCFRCQAEWKRRDELGLWPRGALDGRDSSDYEPGGSDE